MTIKFRKKGTSDGYRIAEEYASEAIKIGEELPDKYVMALNLLCLGNVYTDQERYEDALQSYNRSSVLAQEIKRKDIEASASVQMSEIYNDLGDINDDSSQYDIAKNHALYAAALAKTTLNRIDRGQALIQYSKACNRLGDDAKACENALEAALEVKGLDYKVSQSYMERTVTLARRTEDMVLYIRTLNAYYLDDNTIPSDKHTSYEKLHFLTPSIVSATMGKYIIPIMSVHTHFMMYGLPSLIQRQLFIKTLEQLVELKKNGIKNELLFHSIFSLLVAINPEVLISDDLINVGDVLNKAYEEISFKPDSSGLMSFWLNLELGKRLLVSFETFDNRKDTQAVCLLVVLFLMGFQKKIKKEIIMEFEFWRDELEIAISSIEETPEDLKSFFEDALKNLYCAVPRPVSPKDNRNMPLYVVCRGDIAQNWNTASDSMTSIQMLIGFTLAEIVYRLYEGEVELETIMPKIIRIVKETVS